MRGALAVNGTAPATAGLMAEPGRAEWSQSRRRSIARSMASERDVTPNFW